MVHFRPGSSTVNSVFVDPRALDVALYIRDRLGLDAGLGSSPEFRLAPTVESDNSLLEAADRAAISREWEAWWKELVGRTVLGRPDLDGPIDYYGPLLGNRRLHDVAEPLFEEANTWYSGQADSNRGEWGDLQSPTFRPRVIQEMTVKARPRIKGPVDIVVLTIPVNGKLGWRIRDHRFAITKPLLRDLQTFKEWFGRELDAGL